MKQYKFMKVWDIIYPIGIYYVITTIVLILLDFMMPQTDKSQLFRQMIAGIISIPFLFSFYRQDQLSRGNYAKGRKMPLPDKLKCTDGLCMLALGVCFAVALNNLLGFTGLADNSASYRQVTQTFYSGRLVLEFAALCVIIPLVEEILYRGIVYGRLRDFIGIRPAILISALIFGIIHVNLVQFIYASIFGLLLAYLVEYTGFVYGAALAHMAANLTSVLRAETKVFAILDQNKMINLLVTAVLLSAAILLFRRLWKKKQV